MTGGTGSVGRAIVSSLRDLDHEVWFQYNANQEAADRIADMTGSTGWRCDFLEDPDQLPDREFDIVVNSAGVLLTKTDVEGISDEEWERTFRVNTFVPFSVARRYLPGMKARRWGRIINIGSIYSLRGSTRNAAYNASKHALSGLTKSIAREVAPFGVTANELCPSAIDSDLMRRLADELVVDGRASSVEAYLADVAEANPTGRMARPADLAAAVRFLASEEAAFMNGVSIAVDGGQIA